MRILTGFCGSLLLLGFAMSSTTVFAKDTLSHVENEIKSFTLAGSGGGGRLGRGVMDRARGFDRSRGRQRDPNPSSGFGESEDGLSAPHFDSRSGDSDMNDRRALE